MYNTRVSYEANLPFMNSFSNLRNRILLLPSSYRVLLPDAVVTLHGLVFIEIASYHLYLFYWPFSTGTVFWGSSILMCEVVVNHSVVRIYRTVFPFFPVDIWVILETPGLAATRSCYGCCNARSGIPGTYGVGLSNFIIRCQAVIKAFPFLPAITFLPAETSVLVASHTCQHC